MGDFQKIDFRSRIGTVPQSAGSCAVPYYKRDTLTVARYDGKTLVDGNTPQDCGTGSSRQPLPSPSNPANVILKLD